jgi:putative transcriptional regulator
MTEEPRFITGKFLLAMPGIGDPRFERSVTAMCAHDEAGAMGVGIGRLLERVQLHDLLEQFDIDVDGVENAPVHLGGPVEPQRGFVLHSLDWGGQGTLQVSDCWALSSTIDVLRVVGRANGPKRWLVALGYAGWAGGQLDGELHRHGWHVSSARFEALLEVAAKDRWTTAFRADGVDPRLLASHSGHA